jgi:hypothetical protein
MVKILSQSLVTTSCASGRSEIGANMRERNQDADQGAFPHGMCPESQMSMSRVQLVKGERFKSWIKYFR